MAREVNRLKQKIWQRRMQWRLTCVNFLPIGPAGARTGSVPAKRCAGRHSEVAEIEALIQQRLDARKAKTGRRQMRRVTVLTRWGSC